MSLSRQQVTLLGIFALFLGPVILVVLMRSSWWQYQPAGLKNHGHLVQPPVHLLVGENQAIERKWVILYVLDVACEQECVDEVTSLRQIHKAAGKNREQLAVVLLSNTGAESSQATRLEAIYSEFVWITDHDGAAGNTLDVINKKVDLESGQANSVHTYILDPMRNVILAYGADADPNDIHKDPQRLLKWSDKG